jgi:hypothetical protein
MRPLLLHRLRRVFGSIAILAMLLNALMPTLSWGKVAPANANSTWTEVCSGKGSRWVQLDDSGTLQARSGSQLSTAAALPHGDCDYCLTHAASYGLPPSSAWPTPEAMPVRLALSPLAHRPLHTHRSWSSPAVRAPPVKA